MKKQIISLLVIITILISACEHKETGESNIQPTKIKVGVFNGNGASSVCVLETLEALKIDTGISGQAISASDIVSGKLSEFDAIIFPGGSGSKELNNLGKLGKDKIYDFVKEGKGVVGICAGAYLMMSTEDYPSMKISGFKHIDRKHYNRGRGLVEFELTEKGLEIFPELNNKKAFLQYYDGPVMQRKKTSTSTYTELGKYVTDITPDNYAPAGVTPGQTFIFSEQIGQGQILVIAGHPESTPGMRWIVPRMARVVINSEQISYDDFFVRPEINDSAILFDKSLRRRESKLFWKLLNDTADVQIAAMNELYSYRSRPAVRWTIGLLRSESPEVRKQAAFLLKQTEYSAALPDLEAALKFETNKEVEAMLKESIDALSF